MDQSPTTDLSLDRVSNSFGSDDGYELWFDMPPRAGDATTFELQTLCRGSMLVGQIAARMGWDWPTLLRHVDHLSAPLDGFLLLEVGEVAFFNDQFRRALSAGIAASGLDPYKVKVTDERNANVYILGHGLPPL